MKSNFFMGSALTIGIILGISVFNLSYSLREEFGNNYQKVSTKCKKGSLSYDSWDCMPCAGDNCTDKKCLSGYTEEM